jgi:hypothetical protein
MGARLRSLVTLALLLAAGSLAARLHAGPEPADAAAVPAEPAAAAAPGASLPPLPAFAPPAGETFSEIRERPPFSPSRRPPPEAMALGETPPEAPQAPAPDFTLVGINIGGSERAALIRPPEGARPQWVYPNDLVRGWRVVAIENDRLVLEAGATRAELSLRPR